MRHIFFQEYSLCAVIITVKSIFEKDDAKGTVLSFENLMLEIVLCLKTKLHQKGVIYQTDEMCLLFV